MKTAVLGMGRMGAALAGRLLAGGHEVLVWNRSPGKATDVVKAGAVEAGSLAEAVKAAEVVLTCLSNDAAVRHVALGDGGVRGSIADGVPYIECSTVSPQLTDELAGMFDHFAAVPVLGGPAAIESGQATYLVGTGPQTHEMAGLASTAKLTVNLMLLSGVAALAESFTVGRSGGLHDDQLRELLGEAVAPGLKNRFEALLGAPAAGWWTTVLGAKDAGLAIDVAEGAGIHLQVAPAVRQAYLRAAEQGHGDEDIAAVRYLYRS
jgi:3-hydroxyisobutyrate dehydrogenase